MPLYRWELEAVDANGRRTSRTSDGIQANPQEFEGTAEDFADRRLRDWIALLQGDPQSMPARVEIRVWAADADPDADPDSTTHWNSPPGA
ncbi:hypothetical protein ACIQGZ_16525 [Streptomyces sp. NPDC092296]|uniref:hypothetical protein n=1 Tax=Streptomyces sp. NPDC092296 TaxID=3366012 RepID=UPI00380E733C